MIRRVNVSAFLAEDDAAANAWFAGEAFLESSASGQALPFFSAADPVSLSRLLSSRAFYEKYFQAQVLAEHQGATLFALYFSPESIVVEAHGGSPELETPFYTLFASGEALVSVPAKLRGGAPTVADLSIPVRVIAHLSDGNVHVEKAELTPKSAYYPPLIADPLKARRPRSRRAAR